MSVTFTGASDFRAPITSVGRYSDNTPLVKSDQWQSIVDNADAMILTCRGLDEFMTAMFMVDSISDLGGRISKLVIPYLPGARQDRINLEGDVLFTAKSVAREIGLRGFDRVVSVDPHSNVMPMKIAYAGIGAGMVDFPVQRVYNRLWKGYGGVIAPDKGAEDRARYCQAVIGGDLVFGEKHRDVATGKLTGFSVDVEPGVHYLVVDDICDGGGTFLGLGEKIREQGAYADLFVTHGIFSKGSRELLEIYKNVYTTDTIFRPGPDGYHRGIMTIKIVDEVARY